MEITSKSLSPTESQNLRVIIKEGPFVIHKARIRVDFEVGYNLEKRKWYFTSFSKNIAQMYLHKFYIFLENHEINVFFYLV